MYVVFVEFLHHVETISWTECDEGSFDLSQLPLCHSHASLPERKYAKVHAD